jgi:gluconokinase
LHDAIGGWLAGRENVVLACSALKAAYRQILSVSPDVRIVYLRGDFPLVAQRLSSRHEHYMNPSLLSSQFEALEEPGDALTVDVDKPVSAIVDQIRTAIGL